MHQHTLILTTNKLMIPQEVTIDFVKTLINRGLAPVEYFGMELDNQEDYIDDDMAAVSEEITYIEIHFNTDEIIEYEDLDEVEVDNLIMDLFDKNPNSEVRIDGKDVTIYL